MIKRIAYDKSTDALLHPAKDALFFDGWDDRDIDDNADLLCAEMSRLTYAGQTAVAASLAKIGFEPIAFFGGEGLADRLETGGTDGFMATTGKNLTVLAFRGTESDKLEDVLTDAMTFQAASDLFPGCRVHSGFADRFRRVANQVDTLIRNTKGALLITGHSLGAALATFAAVRAKSATLVTFGSPLVGDPNFRELLAGRKIHRFVDCCDVVARVPPKRFDVGELTALLTELGNVESLRGPESIAAKLAVEGIAVLVAATFNAIDGTMEFTHVSEPRRILEDGKLALDMNEAEFTEARMTARANYLRGRPGLTLLEVLAEVRESLERMRRHHSVDPNEALRAIVHNLSARAGIGQVPIRDLADHAPINYVSAFTGRAS